MMAIYQTAFCNNFLTAGRELRAVLCFSESNFLLHYWLCKDQVIRINLLNYKVYVIHHLRGSLNNLSLCIFLIFSCALNLLLCILTIIMEKMHLSIYYTIMLHIHPKDLLLFKNKLMYLPDDTSCSVLGIIIQLLKGLFLCILQKNSNDMSETHASILIVLCVIRCRESAF